MGTSFSILVLSKSLSPIYLPGEDHDISKTERFLISSGLTKATSGKLARLDDVLSLKGGKLAVGVYSSGVLLVGTELAGSIEGCPNFFESLAKRTGYPVAVGFEEASVCSYSAYICFVDGHLVRRIVYEGSRGTVINEGNPQHEKILLGAHASVGQVSPFESGFIESMSQVYIPDALAGSSGSELVLEICSLGWLPFAPPIWKRYKRE